MPHIHEKIDFTISVYIVFDSKVLLHQHKKLGFWLPVGGHIELDEDPIQAAHRETKEESGLDITILDPQNTIIPLTDYHQNGFRSLITPIYLNIHHFNPDHQHIDFIYFATSESADFKAEPGVIMKWFGSEELKPEFALAESVIFYAQKALEIANSQKS